jgi:hypothetical protein
MFEREAGMDRAMVRRSAGVAGAALVLFGSVAAWAQDAPKPGPEHKKLEYYTGKWTSESEVKANPFMPPGKYTSKDDCGWFQGGFAVVCHSEGGGPMGPMKSVGIMGYSSEDKTYTYYGIDSGGMVPTSVSKGSAQGDTWVYTDESKMGGKLVKSRYTIKQLNPASYTFKWEMQGEGGAWSALMEGKSTKAQ